MGRLENTLFRRGFNFTDDDVPGNLADGIAKFGYWATEASLSMDEFTELTSQFAMAVGEYGVKTIAKATKKWFEYLS